MLENVSHRMLALHTSLARREEALHECVFITIPFADHAHDNARVSQRRLIVLEGILASPIGIVQ